MSLSLWHVPRMMDRLVDDCIHEMNHSIFPYWRNADHSMLHVGNDTQQVRSTILLDDRRRQEIRCVIGRLAIPTGRLEDLDSVRTQLSDKGHLCVEAPKADPERSNRRKIPIIAAPSKN
ncbi:unnamed protein product [Cylicostephanus goldi]|uniref:SHSP domain-containing protein n=1 Tax=Cylicostephanus goldi TaxID=71465 RepID=A0A3P7MWT9_CYLGO|nr:unnamed protein product [Cylicostephanus goldi]